MIRYWVKKDGSGKIVGTRRLEGPSVPNQEAPELEKVDEATWKAAKEEQATRPQQARPRPTPEQEIDQALARPTPEATMFEWVRQKLGIGAANARAELKALHRIRRGE